MGWVAGLAAVQAVFLAEALLVDLHLAVLQVIRLQAVLRVVHLQAEEQVPARPVETRGLVAPDGKW